MKDDHLTYQQYGLGLTRSALPNVMIAPEMGQRGDRMQRSTINHNVFGRTSSVTKGSSTLIKGVDNKIIYGVGTALGVLLLFKLLS